MMLGGPRTAPRRAIGAGSLASGSGVPVTTGRLRSRNRKWTPASAGAAIARLDFHSSSDESDSSDEHGSARFPTQHSPSLGGLGKAGPTLRKRHVESKASSKLADAANSYTLSVAGISNLESSIVQPKFFRKSVRDDDDFGFTRRVRKTPVKLFGGALLRHTGTSQVHDVAEAEPATPTGQPLKQVQSFRRGHNVRRVSVGGVPALGGGTFDASAHPAPSGKAVAMPQPGAGGRRFSRQAVPPLNNVPTAGSDGDRKHTARTDTSRSKGTARSTSRPSSRGTPSDALATAGVLMGHRRHRRRASNGMQLAPLLSGSSGGSRTPSKGVPDLVAGEQPAAGSPAMMLRRRSRDPAAESPAAAQGIAAGASARSGMDAASAPGFATPPRPNKFLRAGSAGGSARRLDFATPPPGGVTPGAGDAAPAAALAMRQSMGDSGSLGTLTPVRGSSNRSLTPGSFVLPATASPAPVSARGNASARAGADDTRSGSGSSAPAAGDADAPPALVPAPDSEAALAAEAMRRHGLAPIAVAPQPAPAGSPMTFHMPDGTPLSATGTPPPAASPSTKQRRSSVIEHPVAAALVMQARPSTAPGPQSAAMALADEVMPTDSGNGVCSECMDNEQHAAHFAAFQGHMSCLEVLVEENMEDVLDPKGRTPLFYAAARNHPDCCALLADVREGWLDAGDNDGDTPLHVAACRGHHGVVELLLQSGAQAALANTTGLTAAHVARKKETLELLVEYGAPLNAIDVNGRSPLFTMVATGRAEAAKTLCALDEDMTSLTLADHRGDTPLHAAACNGYTDCVLLLLQYGVPANTPINDHMLRALHLALVNEHHETALLLRRYGATESGEEMGRRKKASKKKKKKKKKKHAHDEQVANGHTAAPTDAQPHASSTEQAQEQEQAGQQPEWTAEQQREWGENWVWTDGEWQQRGGDTQPAATQQGQGDAAELPTEVADAGSRPSSRAKAVAATKGLSLAVGAAPGDAGDGTGAGAVTAWGTGAANGGDLARNDDSKAGEYDDLYEGYNDPYDAAAYGQYGDYSQDAAAYAAQVEYSEAAPEAASDDVAAAFAGRDYVSGSVKQNGAPHRRRAGSKQEDAPAAVAVKPRRAGSKSRSGSGKGSKKSKSKSRRSKPAPAGRNGATAGAASMAGLQVMGTPKATHSKAFFSRAEQGKALRSKSSQHSIPVVMEGQELVVPGEGVDPSDAADAVAVTVDKAKREVDAEAASLSLAAQGVDPQSGEGQKLRRRSFRVVADAANAANSAGKSALRPGPRTPGPGGGFFTSPAPKRRPRHSGGGSPAHVSPATAASPAMSVGDAGAGSVGSAGTAGSSPMKRTLSTVQLTMDPPGEQPQAADDAASTARSSLPRRDSNLSVVSANSRKSAHVAKPSLRGVSARKTLRPAATPKQKRMARMKAKMANSKGLPSLPESPHKHKVFKSLAERRAYQRMFGSPGTPPAGGAASSTPRSGADSPGGISPATQLSGGGGGAGAGASARTRPSTLPPRSPATPGSTAGAASANANASVPAHSPAALALAAMQDLAAAHTGQGGSVSSARQSVSPDPSAAGSVVGFSPSPPPSLGHSRSAPSLATKRRWRRGFHAIAAAMYLVRQARAHRNPQDQRPGALVVDATPMGRALVHEDARVASEAAKDDIVVAGAAASPEPPVQPANAKPLRRSPSTDSTTTVKRPVPTKVTNGHSHHFGAGLSPSTAPQGLAANPLVPESSTGTSVASDVSQVAPPAATSAPRQVHNAFRPQRILSPQKKAGMAFSFSPKSASSGPPRSSKSRSSKSGKSSNSGKKRSGKSKSRSRQSSSATSTPTLGGEPGQGPVSGFTLGGGAPPGGKSLHTALSFLKNGGPGVAAGSAADSLATAGPGLKGGFTIATPGDAGDGAGGGMASTQFALSPPIKSAPLDAEKVRASWVQRFDPASGYPYYENTYSGETTWERPAVLDEGVW